MGFCSLHSSLPNSPAGARNSPLPPRLMRPQEPRFPNFHDPESQASFFPRVLILCLKEKHPKLNETAFQSPRWLEGKNK